jgi:hypothetical protein
MEQRAGLKQPLLGLMATVIVFFIAFALINMFNTEMFLSWACFLALTIIPIQIIVGLVWQSNYPPPAAKLEQPLKGIYLMLISAMVAAIVAAWSLKTVGGYIVPPTPFLIFFLIMMVIMTFWSVVVWQCWPASAISGHPAFVGFGTQIVAVVVAWILFKVFFDFGFAKGAPFYSASLDPGGLVNAWSALAYFLTTLALILAWVELDFWPLSSIAKKTPAIGKQPLWGIIATVVLLVAAYIAQTIFTAGFGMDVVAYMVQAPICMIFGEFIMLLLFQTSPFQTVKQPAKGVLLIVSSIILALIMYRLYHWFSFLVAGALPSGPPGYVIELWLATSLLSFTFPVIAAYTGPFNYWPLSEPKSQAAPASA